MVYLFVAFLTFCFLYALIWLFERKRGDIDAFLVAAAVVVPTISSLLVALVAGSSGFVTLGAWLSFATLVIVTVLSLWKIMGLPISRSCGYAAAAIVINVLLTYGLFALAP